MIVESGGRRIRSLLILGLGVTGRAVAEFCSRRGIRAFVSEAGVLDSASRGWLEERRIPYEDGGHSDRFLEEAEAVVLSPSVRPDVPTILAARASGLPTLSELDLAALQVPSVPIVAVTGTNGKGTTATLIDAVLRAFGRHPRLGGNIGTPFVSLIGRPDACDVFVLEASSYQLEQTEHLRPCVAALLNLTPDHLTRHGTMDAYAAAKGRLLERQTAEDTAVLPAGLADRFRQGSGRRLLFDAPTVKLPAGAEGLAPHNRLNLAAALCAVAAFDSEIDPLSVDVATLSDAFRLPHRLEEVGWIGDVRIVNDSKSTNADSSIAALRAVDAPVVLLLGGRSKGAGYGALAAEIGRRRVRSTILFGEAVEEFEALFAEAGIGAERARTLDEAVGVGLRAARGGDVLLLSPGCSSFDAYDNYEERGRAFVRAVRARSGFVPSRGKDVGT